MSSDKSDSSLFSSAALDHQVSSVTIFHVNSTSALSKPNLQQQKYHRRCGAVFEMGLVG